MKSVYKRVGATTPSTAGNDAVVLYQAADGTTSLEVRLHEETVWLTQAQMAELFQRDQSVISRHVSNVFKEGELSRERIMQKMHNAFPINPSPSQTAC